VFTISMLPANHGDCLWLEYGSESDPHRILIDGGPEWAFDEITKRLPRGPCHFELLVITHVDRDHIGGILKLLTHFPREVTFGDIWFNAWEHLPSDLLGPAQGEMVSYLIEQRGLPWNEAFGGKTEPVQVPESGELPEMCLPGGMKLTLLSPTRAELARLRPKWKDEVEKAHIQPGSREDARRELEEREGELPSDLLGDEGPPNPSVDSKMPFQSDTSEANGSSIVLAAEYDRKRLLLCGDAYPSLVMRGVQQLTEGRLKLAAVKLSHHGSKKNTDVDLIKALETSRYLVSTNGRQYKHPDNAALSRVVCFGGDEPTLSFNYRSEKNDRWNDSQLKSRFEFSTEFPQAGAAGLTIEL
jgi:Metallo-beta-lactamase superfamily